MDIIHLIKSTEVINLMNDYKHLLKVLGNLIILASDKMLINRIKLHFTGKSGIYIVISNFYSYLNKRHYIIRKLTKANKFFLVTTTGLRAGR